MVLAAYWKCTKPVPAPSPRTMKICVVHGMRKEAVKLGGVDKVVALHAIAQEIRTEVY